MPKVAEVREFQETRLALRDATRRRRRRRRKAAAEESDASGLYTVMTRRRPLEVGGRALGFEILGFDLASFHSSLCHRLEKDFADKLGVHLNPEGFIADEDSARRCAEYTGLDATGAEPALWQPWQVVLYSS
ncbi:MAG: hypothetical protein IPK13_02605 [Deltaproteobacteria bacterium]|nr:hypothetical protein [Deltaproteobacteria bacterium]